LWLYPHCLCTLWSPLTSPLKLSLWNFESSSIHQLYFIKSYWL
jgi:hypothetical protein